MRLFEALNLSQKRELVAFVGGGGKTTALFRLAGELELNGCRRVLVTTTTKMFVPAAHVCPTVLAGNLDGLSNLFGTSPIVAAGDKILPDNKLKGLAPGVVDGLFASGAARHVLVEADGSRGRSLKIPATWEPVIPGAATTVVVVAGLDVLGKQISPLAVHRPELVAKVLNQKAGEVLDEQAVARVLTDPGGVAGRVPPGVKTVYLLNKIDAVQPERAFRVAKLLLEHGAGRVVIGAVGMEDMQLQVMIP